MPIIFIFVPRGDRELERDFIPRTPARNNGRNQIHRRVGHNGLQKVEIENSRSARGVTGKSTICICSDL